MPIAKVQLPDGRIARLEVPQGTTPQQIESFVFNQIYSAGSGGDIPFEQEKPNALVRLGRGFMDVAQGVKQAALMAKDVATGGNEAEQYTREKTEENALYERGRKVGGRKLSDLIAGKENDPGIDWWRLGGNIAATAPVMAIPGAGAAGLGTRVLSGVAQGAVASGLMFAPEGTSKAEQLTIGALLGGAVPVAVEGVKRAASPVVNKVTEFLAKPVSPQQIEIRLSQQGINWNDLTKDVQDSLLSDAKRIVSHGGTLDDAMLRNKALIESVGAKGTRAAITRTPADWTAQKNLRGIQGVGEDIVAREQSDAAAMIDYLQKLRAKSGAGSATPYEIGESAIKTVKGLDTEKEKAVSALYKAFRASGAQDVAVPDTRLADALGKVADEIGTENIPSAVLNRLKEFGFTGADRTKLLTVNEADKLNRLINNNNPGHGPVSKALGQLKQALNEALLDVPDRGIETLKTARSAAAQRFAEQEAGKGISAALEGVSPDNFVRKFVLNADARDLRAIKSELLKAPQGAQVMRDVKGHVFDNLLMKATGASNVDDVSGRAFSGAKFGKALDSIAPEKLHQLFTPDEIGALRKLQSASKLLTEEVPFSDVNYSKTSQALANLFLKLGNTPLLGTLVSPIIGAGKIGADWVKNANARKQVAEALLSSAGAQTQRAPSLANRLLPAPAAAFGERLNED